RRSSDHSARTIELRLFNRNVVLNLIVLDDELRAWQEPPPGKRQLDTVHLSIILKIGGDGNANAFRSLKHAIYADEQPRPSIEVPFFGIAFGRRRLDDISLAGANPHFSFERHPRVELLELSFTAKLGLAFFRIEIFSAYFADPSPCHI